jgi:N-acetylmuramoyl-L-alanine amidase
LADAEFVVCIDPGHGGWDPGWERLDQDEFAPPYFNESEINLAMGLMLREELESRGIAVVMTRETGTASNAFGVDINGDGRTILDSRQDGDRDELQHRINICNEANADVLVSLHLNGFDDPAAHGYEVLYTGAREFGDLNLDLATAIYREIGSAYNEIGFETQARGTKDDQQDLIAETHEFGSEQHLVLTGPAVNNPDYTIVPSQMPGVFVEPVFISNQEDANFIVNPDNQRLLVVAYADGIENFLEDQAGS